MIKFIPTLVAAALTTAIATPVFAQAAIQEPGAAAFYHPNADVLAGRPSYRPLDLGEGVLQRPGAGTYSALGRTAASSPGAMNRSSRLVGSGRARRRVPAASVALPEHLENLE